MRLCTFIEVYHTLKVIFIQIVVKIGTQIFYKPASLYLIPFFTRMKKSIPLESDQHLINENLSKRRTYEQ